MSKFYLSVMLHCMQPGTKRSGEVNVMSCDEHPSLDLNSKSQNAGPVCLNRFALLENRMFDTRVQILYFSVIQILLIMSKCNFFAISNNPG